MFQAPELKSSIWLWLTFLNACAIGQQPMHEMPAFKIHPDLFKQTSLAKGGVHFVECVGVFRVLEKEDKSDTTERYYASFDASFRMVRDQFITEDVEVTNEFTYAGNKTFQHTRTAYKQHTTDLNYTPSEDVMYLFENERLVRKTFNFYKKRLSRFWRVDTVIYNAQQLPLYYDQIWGIKGDSAKPDTLRGEFIYDPSGYLIGYQLAPIGNGDMRVLLSYTGGCATPLFDSIYIDPLVDRSKVLPINAPPDNYLPDRMQDLYRKTASTTVPKLIKLNNRYIELNVDLVPDGLNIEANRNWVKQTSYDPVSGLPRKVVVLYDTQVMHYSFIYQGVVPDWFR
jgi:hypothetical protein